MLPAFTGIAVHDGWKPYKTYTSAVHALCNAHHLRELAAVADNASAGRPEDLAGLLVPTSGQTEAPPAHARGCATPRRAPKVRSVADLRQGISTRFQHPSISLETHAGKPSRWYGG
ncbi:IS66 family transposase [Streptomyces sp. NPDC001156]